MVFKVTRHLPMLVAAPPADLIIVFLVFDPPHEPLATTLANSVVLPVFDFEYNHFLHCDCRHHLCCLVHLLGFTTALLGQPTDLKIPLDTPCTG